jgi:hypothetical protein
MMANIHSPIDLVLVLLGLVALWCMGKAAGGPPRPGMTSKGNVAPKKTARRILPHAHRPHRIAKSCSRGTGLMQRVAIDADAIGRCRTGGPVYGHPAIRAHGDGGYGNSTGSPPAHDRKRPVSYVAGNPLFLISGNWPNRVGLRARVATAVHHSGPLETAGRVGARA